MPPNIVIIVLDAVRAQNLPFYGYHRNTTPYLSSFEEDFVIYENAISSSYWTMPSVASLFTGMHTSGHGLVVDGEKLDPTLSTLPGILKSHGYRCASFVRNFYVSDYSGLNNGFDDFFSKSYIDHFKKFSSFISKSMLNNILPPGINRFKMEPDDEVYSFKKRFYNVVARLADVSIDSGGKTFYNDFSRWLKKYQNTPFFAYFHFLETHSPYRAPLNFAFKYLSFRENLKKLFVNHNHINYLINKCRMTKEDFRLLIGAYDNAIVYTDYLIEKIFNLLKKFKIYNNTMIIILSDHGDNIGDHGLMFHYWCLYDTLIKIPLIIKFPAAINLKGRVSEIVQNVDILPTILSLLNENDTNTWSKIQGNDLLEKKQNKREKGIAISELVKAFGPDREIIRKQFRNFDRRLLSLRTEDFKFIYSSRGDHEFYDLLKNPAESHNLYPSDDRFLPLMEKAEIYYKKMDKFYQNIREKIDGGMDKDKQDESVIKRLKSLGYM
jgi:arylsulfatase A-like enzyme